MLKQRVKEGRKTWYNETAVVHKLVYWFGWKTVSTQEASNGAYITVHPSWRSFLAGCFSQLPWAATSVLPHSLLHSLSLWHRLRIWHCVQYVSSEMRLAEEPLPHSLLILTVPRLSPRSIRYTQLRSYYDFSYTRPFCDSVNCPVTPMSRIQYPNCLCCGEQNPIQRPPCGSELLGFQR